MSQQEWFETASGFMSADQREAFRQARDAIPAGFDREAQMAKWGELNARIKAALPLDPASEEAQRFLDERDAMLQPFLAVMPSWLKEASKTLSEKIDQGELASPIDTEVGRFYREAARERRRAEES